MTKKPKEEKKGHIRQINIGLPEGILGNTKLRLPNIGKESIDKESVLSVSEKNIHCDVWNCDITKTIGLLAEIATNLWRARNRSDAKELDAVSDNMRKTLRHYDNAWILLCNGGFEIKDHTNEPYSAGSDLKVIAFQPMPGYGTETIAETIRPTIYFNNQKIQKGEVIVAIPIKENITENKKE